jgi:hypothetical protein
MSVFGPALSLKRLTKEQLQPIIDKIADHLPSWKADLLTKPGRKILVRFVLTGMLIYLVMALDFPAWAYKAIDKLRRGFFWRGSSEAKGRQCQVAWGVVCRPMKLGGLGISSLKELSWSLRMRWLWLKKTEPNRPWSTLPAQVLKQVKALFSVAMQTEVGDGKNTMFWTDRWLHGQRIEDITPNQFATVPKRRINSRNVHDALTNRRWVADIQGALTVGVISEFLHLWTFCPALSYRRGWMIITFGGLQQVESTQPRKHMKAFSWDQLIFNLSREFGKPGHL